MVEIVLPNHLLHPGKMNRQVMAGLLTCVLTYERLLKTFLYKIIYSSFLNTIYAIPFPHQTFLARYSGLIARKHVQLRGQFHITIGFPFKIIRLSP